MTLPISRLTLSYLTSRYPWIPWTSPVPVKLIEGGPEYLACRVCIANYGLRGADVPSLPTDEEAFQRHMGEHTQ